MSTIQSPLDYQALAQARLQAGVWQYLMDGDVAGDVAALAGMRLWPRPLRDVRAGHSRVSLFGRSYEHPILLAPVAYQRLFHDDGEMASAMAAAAQGGQVVVSSLASQPLEQIHQAFQQGGGQGPWFQLYWQGEREASLRLLRRAEAAGYSAIMFTVDAPIKLATLQLPQHIQAVNLEAPLHSTHASARQAVFQGWMAQAPRWDDVAWLRRHTKLPLLIKGLLHPDDAAQAVAIGCDGVVVSNHGGRVLQGAALSLHALPAIVARLQNQVPVLFDSGIRTGRDVFCALALGAQAVLVGRSYVWGLAANGAMGVAHVLRLLRDDLEMTMALTGCANLSEITEQCGVIQQQS